MLRLPPLAMRLGVYLPMDSTLPVAIGGVVGWYYDRWANRQPDPGRARRMGVRAAIRMIWGVAFARLVAITGKDAPLALVGASFATPSLVIGVAGYAGLG